MKKLTMANTYSEIYIHVVFAVKYRANLIANTWRTSLYQYITGIVKSKNQKLMVVNGVADHVHILLGLKPECNLSDLVRDIKANSSRWINENGYVQGVFEWQRGFGAFSIGSKQVKTVIAYINNQEEHHRKKTFREEYIEFLEEYGVDYQPKYIFEDFGANPPQQD
jgi:putative transposase